MLLPLPFAQHIAVVVAQIVLYLTVHDVHDAILLPQHFIDILLHVDVPLVVHAPMPFGQHFLDILLHIPVAVVVHGPMPFAVHFDAIALGGPPSVVIGKIVPFTQQKMYDLDIGPIVMQQKMYNH